MTRNYKIKAGLGVYTESQTGKAIKSAEWRVTEADLRTRKGFLQVDQLVRQRAMRRKSMGQLEFGEKILCYFIPI
jgi:hypothetical protein